MAAMKMHAVESAAVSEIGYDPASKTLRVRYKGGNLYDFSDIEPHQHKALTSADSIGRHLNSHFRGRGERVSD